MRRCSQPRQQRAAVSVDMLSAITEAADMSIAHHRVVSYTLKIGDVIVTDVNGVITNNFKKAEMVQITFRGSKTDQAGQSTRRCLKSFLGPVCPVFAALLLKRNADILQLSPSSPLCSTSRKGMLSTEEMTKVLRAAAKYCGKTRTTYRLTR
ncbi:hypothetical protein JG687_00011185 [Phytophthora cactorum]|uniref:Uncharacterized protein n=1 Tax=Phytophthora cactorum TaxID=29920 RepID=A0A8T1U7U3_9STRA|nr:hypothetical protein JG687_00011185 [Phytophthora cactorum]